MAPVAPVVEIRESETGHFFVYANGLAVCVRDTLEQARAEAQQIKARLARGLVRETV